MLDIEMYIKELKNYSWFNPVTPLVYQDIISLAYSHQDSLKLFGSKDILPCQTINIWPGKSSKEIDKMLKEHKKSLHSMFINNILEFMREIAVDNKLMSSIDVDIRKIESVLRKEIKNKAIEAAGFDVKATRSLPIITNWRKTVIDNIDFDVIEEAVETSINLAIWNYYWEKLNKYFVSKNKDYKNPFISLLKMMNIGLWPVGEVEKDFIVLIPAKSKFVNF